VYIYIIFLFCLYISFFFFVHISPPFLVAVRGREPGGAGWGQERERERVGGGPKKAAPTAEEVCGLEYEEEDTCHMRRHDKRPPQLPEKYVVLNGSNEPVNGVAGHAPVCRMRRRIHVI
jgi:hypothetical protein